MFWIVSFSRQFANVVKDKKGSHYFFPIVSRVLPFAATISLPSKFVHQGLSTAVQSVDKS